VLVVLFARGIHGLAGAHRAGRGARNSGFVLVIEESGNAPMPAKRSVDYQALEAAIENRISSGSAALDNVRAVLVSVDGEIKIAHYRHDFAAEDTTHVWSITKSVMSR
jgi:hypothetical protein